MIYSMTGYGGAEGQLNGVTYAIEIRTVNSRYFKARIKLPEMVTFLEEEVEKILHKELSRGTINFVLRLKNAPASTLFEIDETALQAYIEKLKEVNSAAGIESPIDVSSLLSLPGVVSPILPDDEQIEKVKKTVLKITRQALDNVKQMRAAEGAALEADLRSHCEAMKADLDQIRSHSDSVIKEYQRKLKKRIDTLMADAKLELDQETLAREMAIFAERSDISEEMSRLESHIQQFEDSLEADGQSGRRLDFLSQEMLREANTIASKAGSTEIVHWVVDMKCRIDRIKEQVQNAE